MSTKHAALYIEGIGTAVPERGLGPEETVAMLKDGCVNRRSTKLLERIVRLTGIEKRYLAVLDYQVDTPEADRVYRPANMQPRGPDMTRRTELFAPLSEPHDRRFIGVIPAWG